MAACSCIASTAWADSPVPTTARGAEKAHLGIVLEVYPGSRPDDAAAHIGPILRTLDERGWAALPESVKRAARGWLPLPGKTDPSMTVAKIRAKFADANRASTRKGFQPQQAIDLFQEGFRWVLENQAIVVADLDAPTWLTEAYVGYATALAQNKQPAEARAAYRTQAISFPDYPITVDLYGPVPAAEFQAVRKQIDASPRGTLLVTVDRPDANVSINQVGRGRGGNFQANVIAGTYEVLVQVGGQALRYPVETDPSTQEHAELRINWDLDSKFVVRNDWIGLENAPADTSAKLSDRARTNNLITLSIVDERGTRWLVGKRESPDAGKRRTCLAELGSDAERAMPECLLDGKYAAGILSAIPLPAVSAPVSEEHSSPSQLRPWLGFAVAVAADGIGIYYAARNGTCEREDPTRPGGCASERDTKLQAGIALGVGTVALAYTAYAYIRYADAVGQAAPPVAVSITPHGGMVTLTRGF